jgi:hypothetical protein
MEQFVTHLRAELRKLGDEDDAAAFRAKGGCAEGRVGSGFRRGFDGGPSV